MDVSSIMAVELKEGDVSTEVVPTVQVSIAVVPVGYIFAEAVVFRAIVDLAADVKKGIIITEVIVPAVVISAELVPRVEVSVIISAEVVV